MQPVQRARVRAYPGRVVPEVAASRDQVEPVVEGILSKLIDEGLVGRAYSLLLAAVVVFNWSTIIEIFFKIPVDQKPGIIPNPDWQNRS